MKKEEFVGLGIDEKLAEKAAEESKKELSGYVPKSRFDEVNEAKKQLETSANDYKTQLEALKTSAGDNETLKQQIAELQAQNQQKDTEYQERLKRPAAYKCYQVGYCRVTDCDRWPVWSIRQS